jgi:AraC-like DNA-binding protein
MHALDYDHPPAPWITFSSRELPTHLDDRARYSLWRDLFTARYGRSFDLSSSADAQFSMRCEFARFGGVHVGQFHGTIDRFVRTSRYAEDANDDFVLGMNCGASRMSFRQLGRAGVIDPGCAVLVTNTEAGEIHGGIDNQWFAVAMPRRRMLDLVGDIEDTIGKTVTSDCAPLDYFRRYIRLLLGSRDHAGTASLMEHISTTLIDLAALSFGAGRDAAEIASMRGLRAARLQDAISNIKASFSDPHFSPQQLARNLKLSARYIQEMLQESGASFTERVTELRLQKARNMLSDPRCNRLRISDIAYDCGFNEASYFNRRFRARFGCSPTQYRGGR